MSERLMMQGALQEKRMRRTSLAVKAAGLIRALKIIIQPAAITPLAELKTGEALALMTELHDLCTEYGQITREIAEIEAELKG